MLTFRFNYAVHALEPFGYHAVNLLLYGAMCVLYTVCVKHMYTALKRHCTQADVVTLTCRDYVAITLSALLYSTHPVHTEAVANISCRAELLCGLCMLCGILLIIRAATGQSTEQQQQSKWFTHRSLLLLLSITATLCKEHGITLIPIAMLHELLCAPDVQIALWRAASYCMKQHQHDSTAAVMHTAASPSTAATASSGSLPVKHHTTVTQLTVMSAASAAPLSTLTRASNVTLAWSVIHTVLQRSCLYIVGAAVFMYIRLWLQSFQLPSRFLFTPLQNRVMYEREWYTRTYSFCYLYARHLSLILLPYPLVNTQSQPPAPLRCAAPATALLHAAALIKRVARLL